MAMVNDEIQALHSSLGLHESEFFCECGRTICKERVTLSHVEFATLRAQSRPLIVAAHVNVAEASANDTHEDAASVADLDSEPMKIRIAENESMFRAANERIESGAQSRGVFVDPVSFLCECPDPGCTEVVDLTLEEYEEVRRGPARFLVVPGHESLAVEANAATVVEKRANVVIADKIGMAGHVAAFHYGQDLDVVSDGER